MGNVLTASHPQELLPLQLYLKDFTFDNAIESLGSTRFMKVARAANSAGCQVWKVFISPDNTVNLAIYKAEFDRIAQSCLLPNLSPFRNIPKFDDISKCVIICRPFHKMTLTDRLTTRPFVVHIERIWYIYQLLRALAQCHAVNVCHGDLKSQNVLLSSSGWLHITDFAFFKPTYLPEDNPSIYSYFFDTSRRQTCYIAPERILSPSEYKKKGELSSTKLISEGLTPAMDIFSAGCVIYELFSDGHPPFTYGSLFKYRKMSKEEAEKEVDDLLGKCHCGSFGPLLKKMLSKNPNDRPSAQTILTTHANLFPEMITFLYNYMNIYRPKVGDLLRSSADDLLSNVMEADDVIAKLLYDRDLIISRLSSPDSPPDSAIFFISLITANLRAIRTASVRISAMRLIVQLCRYASSSISLQRALPYLLCQVEDPDIHRDDSRQRLPPPSPAVQSFAIESIAHLVARLTPETLEDSLIFSEYLLPTFNSLLERLSLPGLISLAKYLGRFAETSLEFVRVRKEKKWDIEDDETQEERDDGRSLSLSMSNLFTSLHSKDNEVKLVLVRASSLKRLYAFFETVGNPELLLSHMITMLNENKDWRMRVAFHESLPLIVKRRDLAASGLGPLITQGLHDHDELVVSRVLSSIRLLSISTVFSPQFLHEDLFPDIVPYLIHPNDCIRGEAAELIVTLDSMLSLADIHSRLLPKMIPYLKPSHSLIRINNKVVLMESLVSPIPRQVWREITFLSRSNYENVFHFIRGRGTGKDIQFKDLIDNRGTKDKLLCMERIIDGMIEQRDKKKKQWRERGRVQLREVDKKECSLITSTKDSFAASGHNHLPMSVSDACVEELIGYKKREAESRMHSMALVSPSSGRGAIERLRGHVVMHLHEHSKGITQLGVSDESSHVASSSSDGSFKLWPCSQLGGDSYGAVRSDATHTFKSIKDDRSWPLSGIGWANGDSQLVVASTSGELLWADTNAEVKEVSRISLPEEDGPIEQIITHTNLTFARTHHGVFYCYDSRVGKNGSSGGKHCVWKKKASNGQAKITSFCIDPKNATWMVTSGTSNQLYVWDMRLLVEVQAFPYPTKGLPVRVWSSKYTTNNLSEPQIFVGNSICGEVSLFNVTTGMRSDVWWPSYQRKPLQYDSTTTTDLNRAASALCVGRGGWVLIGDTKGEMRKWNIVEPTKSAYLSGITQYQSRGQIKYERKLYPDMGQVVVTHEVHDNRTSKDTGRSMGVTEFHRTSITDMAILPSGNVLSAGSDGCIKVWS